MLNLDDFVYCGMFISKEARKGLLEVVPDLSFAENVYLDHMTMLHKAGMDNSKANAIINGCIDRSNVTVNMPDTITLDAIGWSDKAMAFRVKKTYFVANYVCNDTPHVTICTYNGGKPVDSNSITRWIPIEPINVHAKFNVIRRRKKNVSTEK